MNLDEHAAASPRVCGRLLCRRSAPPATASNDWTRPTARLSRASSKAKEVSPEQSTVSDWRAGRGGAGGAAAGIGMSLPLRGRVEDQAPTTSSTAEPFLTQAKGPIVGAVLRDGARHRRPAAAARSRPTPTGRSRSIPSAIAARWNDIRQDFVDYYRPADSADETAEAAHEQLERTAERTYDEFRKQARRVSCRRTSTTSPPISARSIGSRTTRSAASTPRSRSSAAGTG